MHPLKVKATLEFYVEELRIRAHDPVQMTPEQYDALFPGRNVLYAHAMWMCKEALEWPCFTKPHTAEAHRAEFEKANRWLGHVQGLLVAMGIFTLNDLREHSRTGGGKYPDGTVPSTVKREGPDPLRPFPILMQGWIREDSSKEERARYEVLEATGFTYGHQPAVPWGMLAPFEDQARRNHQQSLDTLCARGGLCPAEMLWILDEVGFKGMEWDSDRADIELVRRVEAWRAAQATPTAG